MVGYLVASPREWQVPENQGLILDTQQAHKLLNELTRNDKTGHPCGGKYASSRGKFQLQWRLLELLRFKARSMWRGEGRKEGWHPSRHT